MLPVGILLFLAAAIAGLVALSLLPFKDLRRFGLKLLLISVIAFGVSLAALSYVGYGNEVSRARGFADADDEADAQRHNITNGDAWKLAKPAILEAERLKARAAADEAARVEKIKLDEARLASERKIAEEKAKEARCREDLQCIGDQKIIEATFACRRVVENLAKNDFRWTDGWTETKFSRFRFKNIHGKVITYIGDKIEYQNGIGNWVRHTYECDYNIDTKNVEDARARVGRLPS